MKEKILYLIRYVIDLILIILVLIIPWLNLYIWYYILENLSEWDDWFYLQLIYWIYCILIFILEVSLFISFIN